MTLQDAIKTGKPYRRTSWPAHTACCSPSSNPIFSIDMVMADDWEVEEETRKLTWTQIQEAYGRARIDSQGDSPRFTRIAKEMLGFT